MAERGPRTPSDSPNGSLPSAPPTCPTRTPSPTAWTSTAPLSTPASPSPPQQTHRRRRLANPDPAPGAGVTARQPSQDAREGPPAGPRTSHCRVPASDLADSIAVAGESCRKPPLYGPAVSPARPDRRAQQHHTRGHGFPALLTVSTAARSSSACASSAARSCAAPLRASARRFCLAASQLPRKTRATASAAPAAVWRSALSMCTGHHHKPTGGSVHEQGQHSHSGSGGVWHSGADAECSRVRAAPGLPRGPSMAGSQRQSSIT